MSEIKGIFFNNGIQGIAKIIEDTSDPDNYTVENLNQIVTYQQDQETKLTFEAMTPFANLEKKGLDTKIPKSSCFLYELSKQIEDVFSNYIGSIQVYRGNIK
jgi:hypothetical protein